MRSAATFYEERHGEFTVATCALGKFATKALFAQDQIFHREQWRGWAVAHLCRLKRMDVWSEDVSRLLSVGESVVGMLGEPHRIFRLGYCTAYHGKELKLAYRFCKVPNCGPCLMHTISLDDGVHVRREYTLGVW